MIDTAAFNDLKGYIMRRVSYVRYRIGSTWYSDILNNVAVSSSGTVRMSVTIAPTLLQEATVNRVELYNSDNELWAHQDCSIKLTPTSSRALFWFDFMLKEVS
jgi:hypothetical protein